MSPRVLAAVAGALIAVTGCATPGLSDESAAGPELAHAPTADGATTSAPPTTRPAPSTTVDPSPPVPLGSPDQPFGPLPASDTARAVVSPSGVVMPVVPNSASPGADSWLVATACGDIRWVSGVKPLGRAHVVLDPGHGGREPGAVGPTTDLTEKDLNLDVARLAAEKLTGLGATVILTRTTDITLDNDVRALLARTVDPALFLSIHHNGGAPANDHEPGSMVFTKAGSEPSRRASGLIHETVASRLAEVGRAEMERRDAYVAAVTAHEEAISAYDHSLAARDAALVANGQLDPTATTLPPEPPNPASPGHRPRVRQPVTTTTRPVPDDRATVTVPDTVPVPPPLEAEPVPPFRWAGANNAGVRAWTDPDGADLLTVLRRSGDVPGALIELAYLSNPAEERLLADPAFVELEAQAVVDAVVRWFSTSDEGSGFVADQVGDHHVGGSNQASGCVEPDLGVPEPTPEPDPGADRAEAAQSTEPPLRQYSPSARSRKPSSTR